MSLSTKSLTELRGIAQMVGVADIFSLSRAHLLQAIELKQSAIAPMPVVELPEQPMYDARLMSMPPAEISEREEIEELLEPYVARGLRIKFDDERWYMAIGAKTDEGTLRMPLRVVLRKAQEIMT